MEPTVTLDPVMPAQGSADLPYQEGLEIVVCEDDETVRHYGGLYDIIDGAAEAAIRDGRAAMRAVHQFADMADADRQFRNWNGGRYDHAYQGRGGLGGGLVWCRPMWRQAEEVWEDGEVQSWSDWMSCDADVASESLVGLADALAFAFNNAVDRAIANAIAEEERFLAERRAEESSDVDA